MKQMKADWKPYPKIRPPRTGTYLVTHQNGGVNLGRYEKIDEQHGHFNLYRCEVIAWDYRPEGYKGAEI